MGVVGAEIILNCIGKLAYSLGLCHFNGGVISVCDRNVNMKQEYELMQMEKWCQDKAGILWEFGFDEVTNWGQDLIYDSPCSLCSVCLNCNQKD